MNSRCDEIQEALAERGEALLRDDPSVQAHVTGCADCASLLAALSELDAGLDTLTPLDAPDEWVARVLEQVEPSAAATDERGGESVSIAKTVTTRSGRRAGRAHNDRERRFLSREMAHLAAAASVLLVAGSAVLFSSSVSQYDQSVFESVGDDWLDDGETAADELEALGYVVSAEQDGYVRHGPSSVSRVSELAPLKAMDASRQIAADKPSSPSIDRMLAKDPLGPPLVDFAMNHRALEDADLSERVQEKLRTPKQQAEVAEARQLADERQRAYAGRAVAQQQSGQRDRLQSFAIASEAEKEAKNPGSGQDGQRSIDESLRDTSLGMLARSSALAEGSAPAGKARVGAKGELRKKAKSPAPPAQPVDKRSEWRSEAKAASETAEPSHMGSKAMPDRADFSASSGQSKQDANRLESARLLSAVERFERERREVEGLEFQSASGYWASPYVPGDPELHFLQSRVSEAQRTLLQSYSAMPLLLDSGVRSVRQPFDRPEDAALDVFLHSDRTQLAGPGRALVQVGIQASDRPAGLRPAMQVAVVLDLRAGLDSETKASVRALVEAFQRSREVGDRFSLFAAGPAGGLLVPPESFSHGPLSIALDDVLAGPRPLAQGASGVGIVAATRLALDALAASEDPSAPLGTSSAILVTPRRFGAHTEDLTRLAHASALAGVPMSVVGVGSALSLEELDQIALAGQGNRRLLDAASEAAALVERELSAIARVVARALRVRIRLAAGVKLVEVIGSERLDVQAVATAKEAEVGIDRRMARNWGIEADRGEDEDGIQILIPSFYSGDSAVVLLDVVAEGEGPIADVTLRYKDLVQMRNSVARARLSLDSDGGSAGPLEHNVVKNFLAHHFSQELRAAGEDLMLGEEDSALLRVADVRDLLDGLAARHAAFRNDRELAVDRQLLGEYIALLENELLLGGEDRAALADNLVLAGFNKTLPASDRPSAP